LFRLNERSVGNHIFVLNQDEYYAFLEENLLKLCYSNDNITIEDKTNKNRSLHIIQRDSIFLGMNLEIQTDDILITSLQQRAIFQKIYRYDPTLNNSDYFNQENAQETNTGLKIIFCIFFYFKKDGLVKRTFSKNLSYEQSLQQLVPLKVISYDNL